MTTYTFNHPGGPVSTTADLLRQMEEVMAQVRPEPIGEWMRGQGFPPETSILVLPERMRSEVGPFPPRYVRFSAHAADPILTRDPFAETERLRRWLFDTPLSLNVDSAPLIEPAAWTPQPNQLQGVFIPSARGVRRKPSQWRRRGARSAAPGDAGGQRRRPPRRHPAEARRGLRPNVECSGGPLSISTTKGGRGPSAGTQG